MTDKEKIKAEIERVIAIREAQRNGGGLSEYGLGSIDALYAIRDFIATITKEPVSEDLESTSKQYALNHTPWDDCADEMQGSFKAGAQWQKEQDKETIELAEAIQKVLKERNKEKEE